VEEIPEWLLAGEMAPSSQETPPAPSEVTEVEAREVQEELEAAAEVEAELPMADESLTIEPVAEEVLATPEETTPAYVEETQPVEPSLELVEAPREEIPTEEVVEPTAAEALPELPSWLAEMEETPSEEEEPTWLPPEEAAPEPAIQETAPIVVEQPPREKLNLNTAGLVELERLPGVGFIRAQSIINHRNSQGAFDSLDELSQVSGFDTTLAAELSQWLFIETVRPAIESALNDFPATLIQARNALLQGNQAEALVHYNNLIKARQTLPEVIHDLHEALYRFPIDISIWQALGDAYARNSQIQDALNAYTKAEELLR
jgi:competence ComEA-like helix-hairpin-helix protein